MTRMPASTPRARAVGAAVTRSISPIRRSQWLEFYGSYSGNRARYVTPYNDGTGHIGEYLPNAPFATGSFNVYVKNLGPWSGSLGDRYLSSYPLSSDDAVRGSGYHEWNGDVRYALSGGWVAAIGAYNLLNTKANAMEIAGRSAFWAKRRRRGCAHSSARTVLTALDADEEILRAATCRR